MTATTAEWNESPPYTASKTWQHKGGYQWGSRLVKPDGSVEWRHHSYYASEDATMRPIPGEWLLFADYGPTGTGSSLDCGYPTLYEWTAPADSDGFIRRDLWKHSPTCRCGIRETPETKYEALIQELRA